MGKTISGLFENGGLSALRGAIPIHEAEGWYTPEFMTDARQASPDDRMCNTMSIMNMAPISAVYSNPADAVHARDELVAAEALETSLPFKVKPFGDFTGPLTFRAIGLVDKAPIQFLSLDIQDPLVIFTADSMKGKPGDRPAFGIGSYVYDPLTKQWFLISREGKARSCAEANPYKTLNGMEKKWAESRDIMASHLTRIRDCGLSAAEKRALSSDLPLEVNAGNRS